MAEVHWYTTNCTNKFHCFDSGFLIRIRREIFSSAYMQSRDYFDFSVNDIWVTNTYNSIALYKMDLR